MAPKEEISKFKFANILTNISAETQMWITALTEQIHMLERALFQKELQINNAQQANWKLAALRGINSNTEHSLDAPGEVVGPAMAQNQANNMLQVSDEKDHESKQKHAEDQDSFMKCKDFSERKFQHERH
eukprot:CAMPEP_0194562134 /NCGR_PEP_ID=MMETSP0292-20121207/2663_1 /TAXON_ID=39354 /ORGANISM="Heterosigma akashiwo, Strain CCMP2393" /LENGTH=129 /DNA_ID=CAMNT_0039410707 /DNA_START=92 /DNA_END=481 /DNA_ORIENTATION=+